MTTFLLILQIVAGLFTALAAVASLLKSKGIEEIKIPSVIIGGPETVVRRLTREAKIGIYCVAGGLIVSLAARMTEQHLTNKRNTEALRRTEESLNYLKRLGTRFDTLSFSVKYELNLSNAYFTPLHEYGDEIASPTKASNALSAATNRPAWAFYRTSISNHISGNIVGYRELNSGVLLTSSLSSNRQVIEFNLPLEDYLLAGVGTAATNLVEQREVLAFLCNPLFSVALYAPRTKNPKEPDLCVVFTNQVSRPWVTYYRETKKLFIQWSFTCSKTNWSQTKRLLSLPDLAGAGLYHSPLVPYPIFNSVKPESAQITFDLNTIPLMTFKNAVHFYRVGQPGGMMVVEMPERTTTNLILEKGMIITTFSASESCQLYLLNLYFSKLPSEKEILGEQ